MGNNSDDYLKFAGTHPDFQGLMSFVVREGDIFEIDGSEYRVNHRFKPSRGGSYGKH